MENATKALLIAGGILLSLIIISSLLFMVRHLRRIRQAEAQKIETEQLQKFNQEYEVYNKKLMYGAEVLSVINKIDNYNRKNPQFSISWTVNGTASINDIGKTEIYKCTSLQYSRQTGRVNGMAFEKN